MFPAHRALLLGLLSLPALAAAQSRYHPPHEAVPPWAPRAVYVGAFLPRPFVPWAQVQWEWTLIQERVDALVLVAEAGGGAQVGNVSGVGTRANAVMISSWQVPVLLGLGYRGTRPSGFHWGLAVATGPSFFGAAFDGLPAERGAVGVVEAKVQFGWKLGAATLGMFGGVSQTYDTPARYASAPYVGGPLLGLFADWR